MFDEVTSSRQLDERYAPHRARKALNGASIRLDKLKAQLDGMPVATIRENQSRLTQQLIRAGYRLEQAAGYVKNNPHLPGKSRLTELKDRHQDYMSRVLQNKPLWQYVSKPSDYEERIVRTIDRSGRNSLDYVIYELSNRLINAFKKR